MKINSKNNTLNKLSSWLSRLKNFILAHKKSVLITIAIIVFIALISLLLSIFIRKPQPIKTNNEAPIVNLPEPEKPLPIYYSKLSGLKVNDEASITKPVTAVMIENSPDARPQSGLKEAEIVFEAIAEAGITRFMALYQNSNPEIIGPVRSVRIYYVNWLAGFDASIAHAGGSDEALAEVRNGNYRDLDQFFNANTFWRSTDRYAPHNLYTSSQKLNEINTAKGYTESNFTAFNRIDGATAETLDATNINVKISSYLFNSSYSYDAESNSYKRLQAGEPHFDREKGQITPSAIVVLKVNEYTLADGHESIESIGTGNAIIFQNGTAINAVWKKDSKTSQIILTDAVGTEIPIVRGQTWIVSVPNGSGEVTWS